VIAKARAATVRACLQARARQDTRFNSMLQEQYGGRKAIREFLRMGVFADIRLPPLHRNPEGVRRPEPPPRTRPNAEVKKTKYFTSLQEDLRSGERPAHRTTKLWHAFAEQAREGNPYESRRFPKAAAALSQVAGAERRTPGQQQGPTWEPGVSAGSRPAPGQQQWRGGWWESGQQQGPTWEPGASSRPAPGQQQWRGGWWEMWQGGGSSSSGWREG